VSRSCESRPNAIRRKIARADGCHRLFDGLNRSVVRTRMSGGGLFSAPRRGGVRQASRCADQPRADLDDAEPGDRAEGGAHRTPTSRSPHTCRAVSPTRSNLRHWSSYVSRLPGRIEANPHCAAAGRKLFEGSVGVGLSRRRSRSRDSSSPLFVVTRPSTDTLFSGTKRSGASLHRSSSYSSSNRWCFNHQIIALQLHRMSRTGSTYSDDCRCTDEYRRSRFRNR
jgi:hypothetical protein